MGRIVVTEFASLDGVVEAPGGEPFRHPGWAFDFDRGEEGERFKVDEALAAEALLLGRLTYEGFAEAWPHEHGGLADKYNGMPKYVVSRTLSAPTWPNTTVLTGDLRDVVARVKAEVEGDISVPGSIRLANDLIRCDLVDEIHLMTFPVVLGTGRRLFGEQPDKSVWRLTDFRSVGEGVLITTYDRVRVGHPATPSDAAARLAVPPDDVRRAGSRSESREPRSRTVETARTGKGV